MQLPQSLSTIKNWRRYFPLKCNEDLSKLIRNVLKNSNHSTISHQNNSNVHDINLTFLSLLLGMIEHKFTHIATTNTPSKRRRHSTSSSKSSKSLDIPHVSDIKLDAPITIPSDNDSVQSPRVPDIPFSQVDTHQQVNTIGENFPHITFEEIEARYNEIFDLLSLMNQNGLKSVSSTTNSIENLQPDANSSDTLSIDKSSDRREELATEDVVVNVCHVNVDKMQSGKDNKSGQQFASRQIISDVANFIWSRMVIHQKYDKLHSQSMYSLLSERYLDSFGLAYSVVAFCQLLGYNHVYLTLSEDHAWVKFQSSLTGPLESAEIMQGPNFEDKRGQPVSPKKSRYCWLYMAGWPVICRSKVMTLAAAVTAINPIVTFQTQSQGLLKIKLMLLRILNECDALSSYPLALSNLAELEDLYLHSEGESSAVNREHLPLQLYRESVSVSSRLYADYHVYPYILLAGYLYRHCRYKEAMHYWAEAARVVGRYNYEREDVEIYKEFNEIAYQLIPNILRKCTDNEITVSELENVAHDPVCYADMLRFLDGLCLWEQGSSLPVLHVGWANRILYTLLRFDANVRTQITITNSFQEDNESAPSASQVNTPVLEHSTMSDQFPPHLQPPPAEKSADTPIMESGPPTEASSGCVLEDSAHCEKISLTPGFLGSAETGPITGSSSGCVLDDRDANWSSSSCGSGTPRDSAASIPDNFDISSLAPECSRQLINPDFLIGISLEPFLPDGFKMDSLDFDKLYSEVRNEDCDYDFNVKFPLRATIHELQESIKIKPPPSSIKSDDAIQTAERFFTETKKEPMIIEEMDQKILDDLVDIENNNNEPAKIGDVDEHPDDDSSFERRESCCHSDSKVNINSESPCVAPTSDDTLISSSSTVGNIDIATDQSTTAAVVSELLVPVNVTVKSEEPLGHTVVLKSAKMCDLGGLLTCRKLNASAIQLQLTAQSQVEFKRAGTSGQDSSQRLTRKRLRRF